MCRQLKCFQKICTGKIAIKKCLHSIYVFLMYLDVHQESLPQQMVLVWRVTCLIYCMRQEVQLLFVCFLNNGIFQIELPAPGKSILIHLPPSDPQLPPANAVLQNPAPPIELPHSDYYMRLMFTWLGVDIVVQLFTCLLLENQVLLRSSGINS